MAYQRVHRARSHLPRLAAAFACLLNILLISAPALTPAPAAAEVVAGVASLTTVGVSVVSPKETRVLLTFNQILPQFSIVTNDAERVEIGFGTASRGAGAVAPPGAQGLLKGVEFSQRGQVLSVFMVGAGPIHVAAQPMNAGQALLLTITPAPQHATIDAGPAPSGANLPQYVDRSPDADGFAVVPLRYADISEVVGLLSAGQAIKPNDTFTPQEPAFGSSGFNGNGNGGNNNLAPQAYNPNAQESANTAYGQQIDDSIGVDRRMNAIILRGPPDRIALLKARIAELDKPVASVVLETVFVELTETGARNVGFDYTNTAGQMAVATYQRGAYAASSGVLPISGYTSVSVQAAIFAQVQKGEGRIISRPRISAQSGSSAKIITGDALPILTSIALSGVNAVSQQVQYVNVGVTLQIAPRVSDDGYVTSHIFCEVSNVTGTSQGYPTISQREASTSATVKDGDYFVIGGLTQDNHLTSRTHTPLLGEAPLVGELFKLHQETHSKTELYIVVTPHIVRGNESDAARAETLK